MQEGEGIHYPVLGLVTNRDDPKGRGRVKFQVLRPGRVRSRIRRMPVIPYLYFCILSVFFAINSPA